MNTQNIQNIQNIHWKNIYRSTSVCIDSYENGELRGRLYNACVPAGQKFEGVLDFLCQMESLLNNMQYPQPFMIARNFYTDAQISSSVPPSVPDGDSCPCEELPPAECRALKTGNCATFILRILFRQNASWQGSATWLEGASQKEFRSVLELLLMMRNVLYTDRDEPRAM